MALPSNVSTGWVQGQFIIGLVDGPDADQDTDAVGASGTVRFTASIPYMSDITASPNAAVLLPAPVLAVLDSEGYVCTPVKETKVPAYRGVQLIATDDPDLSNTNWTWTATYSFDVVNGQDMSPPPHPFAVPSGAGMGAVPAADLAKLVRIPASVGTGTDQIIALAASAQSSATAAANSAAEAAAAASVTDSGIAALLTNGTSASHGAVTTLVTDAAADKVDVAEKGAPLGVAPLGSDSRVPQGNLPDFLSPTNLGLQYAGKGLATSTVDGLMPATDKAKLGAATPLTTGDTLVKRDVDGMFAVDTPTAGGHPASKQYVDQLATSTVAGRMSAADKAKLEAATSTATPSTVMMRNSGGDAFVRRVLVTDQPTAADHATRKDYVDAGLALKVAKGELFKNVRDYKQVSDPNDQLSIDRAHAASTIVAYPGGHLNVSVSNENVFTSTLYTDAQGLMLRAGRRFNPVTDPSPVLWVEKFDNSSRDAPNDPATWDSGAGHFNVVKEGGTAPSVALVGYNRNVSTEPSGVGGSIGIHGRASTAQTAPGIWAGWFYTSGLNSTTPPSQMIGIEINLNSKAPDQGWMASSGVGGSRMLVAVTQDNSNPITMGVEIGRGTNAPLGHIHTGLMLRGNSIVPSGANSSTAMNPNEAIRIDGDSSIGNGSTGIRFYGGFKTVGISFQETGFANNAALLFADDQRMVVGPGPASSTWISLNKTAAQVNFNGLALAMNGTKVLGSRATGWGAASGTVDKTAWTTYIAPTISAAYVQAEVQAIANRLMATEQHLAALQQAATTHGQIGA